MSILNVGSNTDKKFKQKFVMPKIQNPRAKNDA